VYPGGSEGAKRRFSRIAALAGVALTLLVSAGPAQATPGHGLARGHDVAHGNGVARGHTAAPGNGVARGHTAAHNGKHGHKVA
jgi:hypothetical protein